MPLRDWFFRKGAAKANSPDKTGVMQPTPSSRYPNDAAGGTPTGYVNRGQLNDLIQGTATAPYPAGVTPPIDDAVRSDKGIDQIQSLENLYVVPSGVWLRYNPDALVRKNGLLVYEKMRFDEQVKAVMNFKRDAIISRGWTFMYGPESELDPDEQKRRTMVFNAIVTKLPGSFIDALNGICTGRDYGFSLTEKVYSTITVSGKQYIGISGLWLRDPRSFEFLTDEYGVLREFRQRAGGKYIPLNLADFVYYVHSPEFDRYYGRSDLREAWRAWYSKDTIMKYWLLYLERMGGGLQVLSEKQQTSVRPGSNEYQAMQAAITNLYGSTGIILPSGWQLEVHTPPSGASDPYANAIEVLDLQIAKALLVPNLLGVSHTGKTGAYSQSQTQLEAFYWTLQADASRLEACLNEQLFRPLGLANFGDDDLPSFHFKPLSQERLRWLITTWGALVTGQAVVPTEEDEKFIRQLMEMPDRSPDDKPLQTPAQQTASANASKVNAELKQADAEGAGAGEEPGTPGQRFAAIDRELAELRAQLTAKPVTVNVTAGGRGGGAPAPAENSRRQTPAVHTHGPRTCSQAAFTAAVQRVQFNVIAQRQETQAKKVATDAAGQIAKTVKRIVGNNDALASTLRDDPASIASLEFSADEKGKLKAVFRSGLGQAYLMGQSMARNELERAGLAPAKVKASRNLKFADLRDNAAEYFDANSYRMAGNASDGVRAIIQQELGNAVRYGLSPQQAREQIWQRLMDKGFVDIGDVDSNEDDAQITSALADAISASEITAGGLSYLDTLTRTNMFEAMNEARYAEFTDPALDGFVEALEYSAILDDRTTEICEALNGSVYAADSPEWDNIRPPNHFNCRSVLVPITQADGWDGQESDAPTVEPAAGFGGDS